jgi:hypothetical protein
MRELGTKYGYRAVHRSVGYRRECGPGYNPHTVFRCKAGASGFKAPGRNAVYLNT